MLIYPRVLGVSVSTSFGQNLKKFITTGLGSGASQSTISGIDMEFIDRIEMRKKYCRLKLGPDNINKKSAGAIENDFSSARIKHSLEYNDLIVGVLYGEKEELSEHFKKLNAQFQYPVYIGKEFWTRLTGVENFYQELISAINEVAKEDGSRLLEETIIMLADSAAIKKIAD